MVRKMSRQRRDLLNLLRERGPQSPATAAPLLGCTRKAAASLLYSCVDAEQVEPLGDGLYGLPRDETIAAQGETLAETMDGTVTSIEMAGSSTETREFGGSIPVIGESESGTYVYSSTLHAMIPKEESRRNKGYVG